MKTFSLNELSKQNAYKAVGFSELREIFEKNETVVLSSNAIRTALINDYNFTDGQASGTIRRACKKQLLFAAGNASYVYNIDFPHNIAPYIKGSNNSASDESDEDSSDPDENSETENPDSLSIINKTKLDVDDIIHELGSCVPITTLDCDDIILIKHVLSNIRETIIIENDMLHDIISDIEEIENESFKNAVKAKLEKYIAETEKNVNIADLPCDEILWIRNVLSTLKKIVTSIA